MLVAQTRGQSQYRRRTRTCPSRLAAHVPHSDACLQLLLRYGTNVQATNKDGRTALHQVENPVAALVLLQHGARSHVPDAQGVTPLHTALALWCRWRRGQNLSAVLFDETNLAQFLWKRAGKAANAALHKVVDPYGRTVLHYAAQVRYSPAPDYVQALVEQCGCSSDPDSLLLHATDANGWTALHVAVAFGNYATAVRLVKAGANVLARDPLGRTPLHLAGYDAWAMRLLGVSHQTSDDLARGVQVVAFGKHRALPAPQLPPSSEASRQEEESFSQQSSEHRRQIQEDEAACELVRLVQYQGFDFTTTDHAGNLPFGRADNDTLRYLTVHAAACQGLLR